MKAKLLIAFLFISLCAFAQVSDISTPPGGVQLTAACTNANSTCDVAGTTIFNPGSPFTVLGPATVEGQTNQYGLAQITASGTYSGSTINFEFSDDGGTTWYPEVCTRSDVNIQESSEVVPANAFRGWECSIGAATKFRVRQSAISTGGPVVKVTFTSGLLEPAPTSAASAPPGASNPCANPSLAVTGKVVSTSGTAATQIIALAAGQSVYICSLVIGNGGGTTPTVALQYGTGSNCGTGTATFLPAVAIPAGTAAPLMFPANFFSTPAGQAVCYIQTGTTPTGTLIINYIQN